MIDIKAEAEKMVESHCENEGCRFDYGLSQDIETLCTRVADEAREEATKALVNEVEKIEAQLRRGGMSLNQRNDLLLKQSHATEFATVIRNSKGTKQ